MKFEDVKPTDEELRVLLEIGFLLREMSKFDDAAQIFKGWLRCFRNQMSLLLRSGP
jgi:hypothetical protein